MIDSVVIKSASSSNTLTLSESSGLKLPPGKEYFRVTVTGEGLSASAKIYAYQPYSRITTLFDTLAVNWSGWTGVKQWSSLEGELTLKCTSQKTGIIKLNITLLSGHYDDDWSIETKIYIEPNQLDKIASDMKLFFLKSEVQD